MFLTKRSKSSKLTHILCSLMIGCFIFISLFSFKYYSYITLLLKPKTRLVNVTCRQYIAPDNRSFFERDYPQLYLPQQISNFSYENSTNQLRSFRLVVLSCARDIAHYIDKYRSHIEPILNLFHSSSSMHIFENDSKDKTVEKLRQWSRVHVYTHKKLINKYRERTERLAYCRNTLLNKAHSLSPDYILFTDPDVFSTDVLSFLSNFKYNQNDWSVMTAGNRYGYYDIWALRTLADSVMNYDVWHRTWNLSKSSENYCSKSISDQIIGIHQKHIPIEHGLVEVRSAFGGAALYKANSTYECQYDGKGPICEHVPFHLCIRDKHNGRIFINPEFYID
ncbi:unnamed protein product [Adineta ricciae]|uniref:Uncharacterized protein n=1 Tax=Adineta ricciae TaxID=249248 RepID=A0A813TZX6_ADIRI|nr:unnamed protein product [Adineta ricciae]CAF1566818.1 unnamed protein product [Adineta ricciae]